MSHPSIADSSFHGRIKYVLRGFVKSSVQQKFCLLMRFAKSDHYANYRCHIQRVHKSDTKMLWIIVQKKHRCRDAARLREKNLLSHMYGQCCNHGA